MNYNHQQNLSINSISSINEPLTPPDNSNSIWENPPANSIWEYNSNDHLHNRQRSCSVSNHVTPSPGSRSMSVPYLAANGSPAMFQIGNRKIDKELLIMLNKIPLQQLRGDIMKLSKDQFGCRFLQKKIDENLVNFEIIFQEIYLNIYELIIDPFGNYLIQKLINYCNELQLNLVVKNLSANLFQISINQHGTRALQKIIEYLTNNYQINLIINGLSPFIIDLIKDLNGNHVIQKILNRFEPENCQFIYQAICNDIIIVSTHKHGCCVLQKCLNHVTADQLMQFSTKIIENSNILIKNQFGNYVIQYLLSLNNFTINLTIFNKIRADLNELIVQKFASNVIEKFLKNCHNCEKLEFSENGTFNELFNPEAEISNFTSLKNGLIYHILSLDLNKFINDPYGNYVIQTLIDVLSSQQQQIFVIKTWFKNCKILSSFGKRIQSKINSILNGNNGVVPNNPVIPNGSGYNNSVNMNSNGEFIVKNYQYSQFNGPNNGHVNSNSVDRRNSFDYYNYNYSYGNVHGNGNGATGNVEMMLNFSNNEHVGYGNEMAMAHNNHNNVNGNYGDVSNGMFQQGDRIEALNNNNGRFNDMMMVNVNGRYDMNGRFANGAGSNINHHHRHSDSVAYHTHQSHDSIGGVGSNNGRNPWSVNQF